MDGQLAPCAGLRRDILSAYQVTEAKNAMLEQMASHGRWR